MKLKRNRRKKTVDIDELRVSLERGKNRKTSGRKSLREKWEIKWILVCWSSTALIRFAGDWSYSE
jgi:hypothetical protein